MTKPLEALIADTSGLSQLRAELSSPVIGSKDHLRKISLSLIAALAQAKQESEQWRREALSNLNSAARYKSLLEASQLAVKLPPHKFSECVNGLLEEAIAYAGTQQLRARLSSRLSNFVKPDHAGGTVKGDEK